MIGCSPTLAVATRLACLMPVLQNFSPAQQRRLLGAARWGCSAQSWLGALAGWCWAWGWGRVEATTGGPGSRNWWLCGGRLYCLKPELANQPLAYYLNLDRKLLANAELLDHLSSNDLIRLAPALQQALAVAAWRWTLRGWRTHDRWQAADARRFRRLPLRRALALWARLAEELARLHGRYPQLYAQAQQPSGAPQAEQRLHQRYGWLGLVLALSPDPYQAWRCLQLPTFWLLEAAAYQQDCSQLQSRQARPGD